MADVVHTAVLVLIVVSAFFAAWFRDLLAAVVSLAIMSLVISLEFYILQAPDVAIAEAGIGAGLSTAIYMIALRACKRTRR
jgi:uncharacterized MnhB-related membrane protein